MKRRRNCPTNVFKDYWMYSHYLQMNRESYLLFFAAVRAVMYADRQDYDEAADHGIVFW